MDVKSVSKPAVQSAPPPKHTEEARKPPVRDSKPPEQQAVAKPTPPKPVVNTQGQETGRHLNVTA